MILRAKILILFKAPPENRFIIPKIFELSEVKNFCITSLLTPGIGINVPNLYVSSIVKVKNTLCFKSELFCTIDLKNLIGISNLYTNVGKLKNNLYRKEANFDKSTCDRNSNVHYEKL